MVFNSLWKKFSSKLLILITLALVTFPQPSFSYVKGEDDPAIAFGVFANHFPSRIQPFIDEYKKQYPNHFPAKPTGLAFTLNDAVVNLSWVDNATTETKYKVTRDNNILAELPINTQTYSDITTSPGGTYVYRVMAVGQKGFTESDPLTVNVPVIVPPPPPPPSGDKITDVEVNKPGFASQGVPFVKGVVLPSDKLEVKNSTGSYVKSRITKTAKWPDGSVKWALFTFVAPSAGLYDIVKGDYQEPLVQTTPLPFSISLGGSTVNFPTLTYDQSGVFEEATTSYMAPNGVRLDLVVRQFEDHSCRGIFTVTNTTPTDKDPANSNQPRCNGFGMPAGRLVTLTVNSSTSDPINLKYGSKMSLPDVGMTITLLNNKELRAGEQIGFEITVKQDAVCPTAACTADYYASTKVIDPWPSFSATDPEVANYNLNCTAGVNGMYSNRGKYPQFQKPDMMGEDQRDWDGGVVETDQQTHDNEYESTYAHWVQWCRHSRINHPSLGPNFDDNLFYLASTGAFHHSTNDIYHVWAGDFHWMWYGPWQHPRHGGSGNGEQNRSSFPPNTAHYNGRGDLLGYYFTGNPFMLKGYSEIMESVMWKVENSFGMPGISGTNGEERGPANLLGLSYDWYNHLEGSDQTRIRNVIKRIINESYDRAYINQANWASPTWSCKPWMAAMLGAQYARGVDHFSAKNDAEMVTLCTNCRKGMANFLANYCYVLATATKPAHMPYQVGSTKIDDYIDSFNLTSADAICDDYPAKAKILFATGSTYIWYMGHPIGTYAKFNNHANAMIWGGRYLKSR